MREHDGKPPEGTPKAVWVMAVPGEANDVERLLYDCDGKLITMPLEERDAAMHALRQTVDQLRAQLRDAEERAAILRRHVSEGSCGWRPNTIPCAWCGEPALQSKRREVTNDAYLLVWHEECADADPFADLKVVPFDRCVVEVAARGSERVRVLKDDSRTP